MPRAITPSVFQSSQPHEGVRLIAVSGTARPIVRSTAPPTSTRPGEVSGDSGTKSRSAAIDAIPPINPIQKIQW